VLASLARFSSRERFSVPVQPKSIVYIRPDTIGDLVIFTSALAQLKAAWPDARHTLVVRPGYDALAPLFPRGIEWLVAPLNPFKQKPGECRREFDALLAQIKTLAPDIVVAAALNRTWLEAAVSAQFPTARRVSLGSNAIDPLFANALRLDCGVDAETAFDECVTVDGPARDWEHNHLLVDRLVGHATPRSFPALAISDQAAREAGEVLQQFGLQENRWVAAFAGGLANVPIKAWPAEKFAEVVRSLQQTHGLPVLLMGHVSEKSWLEAVGSACAKDGSPAPKLWLGRDGEIPLLAALLAKARLYVGHDTGAMHIAAATGRPTVGIFGGGHWPRFRPVGHQVASVVHPLPCFGCNWDCHFGDAPCVKLIAPADVTRAVDAVLAAGAAQADLVVEAQHVSNEALHFIKAVTPRYRALQSDRLERQHRIEDLKREADGKDTEIASLKGAANIKDTEIAALKRETDGKDSEIASLKIETNHKDTEIAALKKSAEERKQEMEAIKAELEAECDEKDAEIAQLKSEADGKDTEIAALKDVCNVREALIIKQDGHIKHFQAMVARHEQETAARVQHIKNLEDLLAKLPPDAPQWATRFNDQNVHIGNIETMLAARDREAAALRASVDNYNAGYASLEQAKYYGKLLAEKEAVLQVLNRACVEREAVIKQLALENAGLGRVGKLWAATKAHWQLKYWTPFNDWLFKKVVEEYWMQIGVLQHYEPRPLTWENFPKPRLDAARLPQVGIVTPSYGQPAFIESTMLSVFNQQYPKLKYVVQDGGSKDASPQIIARYADRLHHWESAPDKGQADAIRKGFKHVESALGPDDIMAWLNSDDFLAPRALRYVAEFFATHPDVDAVYGHRIIIDGEDREVGRWIMPRHDPKTLEWIDYVPQETLFWRKRIWDRVGGIDPSFQFALDWDLLARFQQAKAKIVRVPYFLGAFRVHRDQKTSQHIHTIGNDEMIRIRSRFHGDRHSDFETINRFARKARFTGALTARLAALGIRF
jgi:ADP-heptose:LPS heptosyltransferase/GT2 family glycosyltransferase